jgi:hypothetical protein
MYRRKGPLSFLVLLPISLFLAGCSDHLSDHELDRTKQRGNEIIRALKQFRVDNKTYPASLDELSPKYLAEIPQPTWGVGKWQYHGRTDDFALRVDESIYTGDGDSKWLKYFDDTHEWEMGD